MIIKSNFNPIKVIKYVKTEMFFALLVSTVIYFYSRSYVGLTGIPFSVSAILGSALAIFIAFRNNTSYSRWWEARTLWGGIINATRVLARLIITFTNSHAHQPGFNPKGSEQFKKEMVYLLIAWVHALRLQLRNHNNWDELRTLMSDHDFQQMKSSVNKPNQIHLISGSKIYEAMANGTLGGFDSFQMEGQLLALANYQGGCERIKNTPLLRQYNYFTKLFLYAFMLLLPLSLLPDLQKMKQEEWLIPLSMLISFVFSIIGKVGEVNEDPFENKITDVPLSALCNTIERDLRDMLGETELPAKSIPEKGFLF